MCELGTVELAMRQLDLRGIELVNSQHRVDEAVNGQTAGLRARLLANESSGDIRKLSQSTFWEITPKYRLDLLRLEIPEVANQLALSIGFGGRTYRT